MRKRKAVLLAVLTAVLAGSCQAFVPPSTKTEALAFTWTLDSVYVDTVPEDHTIMTLTFNQDMKSGYFTDYELVTPPKRDSIGRVIEEAQLSATGTRGFTVSGLTEGSFTLTFTDGTVMSFTFLINEPAQLLHLYQTASDGVETHWILREVSVTGIYN